MPDYLADQLETRYVQTASGRIAYRRAGTANGTPLVLLSRFRGTMDHWDPAFLDVLATERDVILFDNAGVGRSSGTVPDTVTGMAADAVDFINSLGVERVDLLGWSLGGQIAQTIALHSPGLIRRLAIAAGTPGPVPDLPPSPEKVWQLATKPVNDDEDFLYIFFPETEAGRNAGTKSLQRLSTRLAASHTAVSEPGIAAQIKALARWQRGTDASWDHLDQIHQPVLLANGMHDVMTPVFASYAMTARIANAKLVLYSDAGHGFLFHHVMDFGHELLRFLL
jgi:pimeloyl-ACP methyl ester carboxylesterase